MEVHTHIIGNQNYAEIKSQQLLFNSSEDTLSKKNNIKAYLTSEKKSKIRVN